MNEKQLKILLKDELDITNFVKSFNIKLLSIFNRFIKF